MTQQEGIVLEISGRTAKVKTSRHNDCENCGACPGNSAIIVDAYNPLAASVGQHVALEVQEVNMLKAAFIVYILPLIMVFAGAILGTYIAAYVGVNELAAQFTGGVFAFSLSVWYIKYFDYSSQANEKMRPVIIAILSK